MAFGSTGYGLNGYGDTMTVHMIRVCAGLGGQMAVSDIEAALDDWVSKHSEWAKDTVPHTVSEANTEPDGSGTAYALGSYRFKWEDSKDNLFQKCGDKLKKKLDWYRLGYHECDHDADERAGCSWDDKREWTDKNVTIPAGVPDFL